MLVWRSGGRAWRRSVVVLRARVRSAIIGRHLECPDPQADARRSRPGLLRDIAIREFGQGDRQPGIHHRAREIGAARAARGDRPAMNIDVALLATDLPASDHGGELVDRRLAARPCFTGPLAALRKLWSIDPVESDRDPAKVERVPVGCARATAYVLRKGRV